MNKIILGLFFATFFGCANNYRLEKSSSLSFTELYYKKWTSGVQGGGSGFNIYLTIDFNKENTKIQGVYFREMYGELKLQKKNKYQGFVKNNENLKPATFDNKTNSQIKTNNEDIPFSLEKNEAVVSYIVKEKKKYVKITLVEKQTMEVPM